MQRFQNSRTLLLLVILIFIASCETVLPRYDVVGKGIYREYRLVCEGCIGRKPGKSLLQTVLVEDVIITNSAKLTDYPGSKNRILLTLEIAVPAQVKFQFEDTIFKFTNLKTGIKFALPIRKIYDQGTAAFNPQQVISDNKSKSTFLKEQKFSKSFRYSHIDIFKKHDWNIYTLAFSDSWSSTAIPESFGFCKRFKLKWPNMIINANRQEGYEFEYSLN